MRAELPIEPGQVTEPIVLPPSSMLDFTPIDTETIVIEPDRDQEAILPISNEEISSIQKGIKAVGANYERAKDTIELVIENANETFTKQKYRADADDAAAKQVYAEAIERADAEYEAAIAVAQVKRDRAKADALMQKSGTLEETIRMNLAIEAAATSLTKATAIVKNDIAHGTHYLGTFGQRQDITIAQYNELVSQRDGLKTHRDNLIKTIAANHEQLSQNGDQKDMLQKRHLQLLDDLENRQYVVAKPTLLALGLEHAIKDLGPRVADDELPVGIAEARRNVLAEVLNRPESDTELASIIGQVKTSEELLQSNSKTSDSLRKSTDSAKLRLDAAKRERHEIANELERLDKQREGSLTIAGRKVATHSIDVVVTSNALTDILISGDDPELRASCPPEVKDFLEKMDAYRIAISRQEAHQATDPVPITVAPTSLGIFNENDDFENEWNRYATTTKGAEQLEAAKILPQIHIDLAAVAEKASFWRRGTKIVSAKEIAGAN